MSKVKSLSTILPLEKFWTWLGHHHNCISRAGTPAVWLYDQDDLHWHLADEGGGRRTVSLMRGKHILGELTIEGQDVLYVDMAPSAETDGHYEFTLLGGSESDVVALFHFVLAHEYDEAEKDKLVQH